jgi:hypothetical protein
MSALSSAPLSTIPDITTSVARRICEQPVRQPRLLHPCLGRLPNLTLGDRPNGRHNDCNESARSLLLGASSGFCLIAIWRRIAQDRRGARHRPLHSRIKGARCAAVGRVTVQRLIATFLALPHIARIRVLFRAQHVSAMCLVVPSEALPDQPTPVKARALRARLRRLTALTGLVCPGV